jgi:AraC family transcriptional regulator
VATPPLRSNAAVNVPTRELGTRNAILWGKARSYQVENFAGPLSVKFVIRGSAVWETENARWMLGPGSYLILNHGRTYSISIDAAEPVETFCLFFRRGFIEDVLHATITGDDHLLDEPETPPFTTNFFERVQPPDRVTTLLRRMHSNASSSPVSRESQEGAFLAVAQAILRAQHSITREAAKIPAAKSATREELLRRVSRGRDYLESFLSDPIRLEDMARAACLSPYHFHRLFRQIFGEGPHHYLVRRRLERAKEMLRGSDVPVTQVCLDTGFESLGSFSTLFRQRYGMPPSQWRSAH